MTAKQVFEATSIELNKLQAPALKLYEFNYLFNKAIYQYINKTYNFYDTSQQTTDDLRVLKSTAYLEPKEVNGNTNTSNEHHSKIKNKLRKAWYEVEMPVDYLHILNCVCIYKLNEDKYCYNKDDYAEVPATRLTSDSLSQILTDVYNRPTPMNPYYYIHNVNISETYPTNPYNSTTQDGTDMNGEYNFTINTSVETPGTGESTPTSTLVESNTISTSGTSNLSRSFTIGIGTNSKTYNKVEKEIASRIGNASKVRCEIIYGNNNSVFELVEVQMDYIKVPQHIRLTQQQLDLTVDTSQIMEFPDYVNQEIINELVHLVMEKSNDPRLGNHIQMTQTIARPAQQQPQQTN